MAVFCAASSSVFNNYIKIIRSRLANRIFKLRHILRSRYEKKLDQQLKQLEQNYANEIQEIKKLLLRVKTELDDILLKKSLDLALKGLLEFLSDLDTESKKQIIDKKLSKLSNILSGSLSNEELQRAREEFLDKITYTFEKNAGNLRYRYSIVADLTSCVNSVI